LICDYFREEHRHILQIIGSLTARHISDLQRIEGLQGEVNRLTTDVAYKDPHVSSYRLGNIIGNSPTSQAVVEFINTVSAPLFNRIIYWNRTALQEATIGLPSILVTGPTGSGKEFFFNNLSNKLNELYRQQINPGGELPVKKTNIASYSGELTYSELFGHKKGAFTGAYSYRRGPAPEINSFFLCSSFRRLGCFPGCNDADTCRSRRVLELAATGGVLLLFCWKQDIHTQIYFFHTTSHGRQLFKSKAIFNSGYIHHCVLPDVFRDACAGHYPTPSAQTEPEGRH